MASAFDFIVCCGAAICLICAASPTHCFQQYFGSFFPVVAVRISSSSCVALRIYSCLCSAQFPVLCCFVFFFCGLCFLPISLMHPLSHLSDCGRNVLVLHYCCFWALNLEVLKIHSARRLVNILLFSLFNLPFFLSCLHISPLRRVEMKKKI